MFDKNLNTAERKGEQTLNLWMQPLGPIQTNGYVLTNDKKQGIVIDPGMDEPALLEVIKDIDVQAILLTHAHFDHIGGLEAVRKQTGAPVYIHDEEADWLLDADKNGSSRWLMVTGAIVCQERDHSLMDQQTLELAGLTIKVLHTPGHSPGSVSFYIESEGVLIAGDTLFAGSIGRTDLTGGDYETLITSIKQQLLTLPEETKVYPGHGPETVIKDEKMYNPFLSGR